MAQLKRRERGHDVPRSRVWRGDLLRAWLAGPDPDGDEGERVLERAARQLGYERTFEEESCPSAECQSADAVPKITHDGVHEAQEVSAKPSKSATPRARFWRVTQLDIPKFFEPSWHERNTTEEQPPMSLREYLEQQGPLAKAPRPLPIAPRSRLEPALSSMLGEVRSAGIDLPALTKRLARAECVGRLPKRSRQRWPGQLEVVIDRSHHLMPFWADQNQLYQLLRRVYGGLVRVRVLHDGPDELSASGVSLAEHVLLLSDLGQAEPSHTKPADWLAVGDRLRQAGRQLSALCLVPFRPGQERLARSWRARTWEHPERCCFDAPEAEERRTRALKDLQALMAPALRVDRGWLRRLRTIVGRARADLSVELAAWWAPEVARRHVDGFELVSVDAHERAAQFKARPSEQRARAIATLRAFHEGVLPPEIWAEEVANIEALWPTDLDALGIADGDTEGALELYRVMRGTFIDGRSDPAYTQLSSWLRRSSRRLVPAVMRGPIGDELHRAWAEFPEVIRERELPASMRPSEIEAQPAELPTMTYRLSQRGGALRLEPVNDKQPNSGGGSPLMQVELTGRRFSASNGSQPAQAWPLGEAQSLELPAKPRASWVIRDLHKSIKLECLELPGWATRGGRDHYGLWADLEVKGVCQRMRYIPPGAFWMGSPEDEAGRWDDEGPRHPVLIRHGFWLGTTPVTQGMYEAVIGENPSQAGSGPRHPVDSVSWRMAHDFMVTLSNELSDVARADACEFRLPTEAEWEYACRAGTSAATYVGELGPDGATTQELDRVAWHDGNSRESTHPVREEDSGVANGFGLLDMLGNVWEHCLDPWRDHYDGGPADGSQLPPGNTDTRVRRGGSWSLGPRFCRAAARSLAHVESLWSSHGFRLARGQAALKPASRDEQTPSTRGKQGVGHAGEPGA